MACHVMQLHFAYDPMQQAGSNHFVLAKFRRNVLSSRSSAARGLAVSISR